MSKWYIIGDIHGCYYTLCDVLSDIKKTIETGDTICFLGDYFDRGPHSAQVYTLLRDLQNKTNEDFKDCHIKILRGNHEQMLIDSYSGSYDNIYLWYSNGGRVTSTSFEENNIQQGWLKAWLHSLPYYVYCEDYNFFCVHSYLPVSFQIEDLKSTPHDYEDCLWLRRPNRAGSARVFHGHTPVKKVSVDGCDVNLDTGCVFGQYLSYAIVNSKDAFQAQSIPLNEKDKVKF